MISRLRTWEHEETAPPSSDRPTTPMRLEKFQRWVRLSSTCPESEIRPFDRDADYPDPGESGVMPAVRPCAVSPVAYEPREPVTEMQRPRFPSGALFQALRVKR